MMNKRGIEWFHIVLIIIGLLFLIVVVGILWKGENPIKNFFVSIINKLRFPMGGG
jgi:hypothetical protein